MKGSRAVHVWALGTILLGSLLASPTGAHAHSGRHDRCRQPVGVVRSDVLLETVSTLPHSEGRKAVIDVRRVSPTYPKRCPRPEVPDVVVMVHGRTIEAITAFDLPVDRFSVMERLARSRVETFAFNFVGFGLSSRFGLDDPCNASPEDQQKLIPNPLKEPCPQPDAYSFTTQTAMWDQLHTVVGFAREQTHARRVSLFGWSMGGPAVASYAHRNPDRVKNLVLETPAYTEHVSEEQPDDVPRRGSSLGIVDRRAFEAGWASMADDATCPGQRDNRLLDPIWTALMDRDPVGSQWGDGGVLRFPHADRWGWGPNVAGQTKTPTLLLAGLRDTLVTPAQVHQTYRDLGSPKKVVVDISCGSHYLQWESSTAQRWQGPRVTLADATAAWITQETFHGSHRGAFTVGADGEVLRRAG